MQLKDETLVNYVAFAGFALAAGRGFISDDGWLHGDACRHATSRAGPPPW